MGVAEKWRAGAATDPGRLRMENQDRDYVDEERGVFLVVDGLGGHAAGEKAADTALEVIPSELAKNDCDIRARIRNAIATANNRILDLAAENEAWRGMACVLTLAVMEDDKVIVGHVGDSRLYLMWNGALRKLTSDHSPVGEREDRGELTEQEAMQHPRRHEVFRDVGSRRREPDDAEFIEMKEFLFKTDAAILLCSDGLSDLVTSAQMCEIIERYYGDPRKVASDLVEAANLAGGKDNVTAVFVAGGEFFGNGSPEMAEARTLYVFDVRSPEEYAAGHIVGARSAPGGQLVQATDAYMATRNARIVLTDDDGVRAVMTASWLKQMGWQEVFVLDGGLVGRQLAMGAEPRDIPGLDQAREAAISVAELKSLTDRGAASVVDLAPSLAYEAGHVPGAWFAVRARLPGSLARVPRSATLVLTSPDGVLARLAAAELGDAGHGEVRVLDGGTAAWRAAGLPLAKDREAMADTPNDCWRRPYDPYAGEGARERYLSWEIELVHQIEREGDLGFRVPG